MLGFLSPQGEFFECERAEHIPLADKILRDVYRIGSDTPVDKLCACGWVTMQDLFVGFVCDDISHCPKLSYEQKDWLITNKCNMSHSQLVSLKMCFEINGLLYE